MSRQRLRARRGASLIELLIAMTLLSVIMASVLGVLRRQQRYVSASSAIIDMRAQLQGSAAILPMDLRSASASATDPASGAAMPDIVNAAPLSTTADKMLALRVTLGSAIACSVAGAQIVVPATGTLSSGAVLTSWTSPPQVGDTIYILDEGAGTAIVDDFWRPRAITAVTQNTSNACPTTATVIGAKTYGPFTSTADAATKSWTLTLSTTTVGALPATVEIGAPVRLVRRVRYELYQAGDQQWYLGFCEGADCQAVQPYKPLAGPLRPYVSVGHANNGLKFSFYDTAGVATTVPRSVARVDISIRGITGRKVSFVGGSTADFVADTLRLSVALRNRL
jgi:prepilin-type N-terminal cleavage/methylation domain-containing protein